LNTFSWFDLRKERDANLKLLIQSILEVTH
jgi:hypothetical protein